MNFDPLPDADNAAVGSHHSFDFFRRHHIRVSLFYIGKSCAAAMNKSCSHDLFIDIAQARAYE